MLCLGASLKDSSIAQGLAKAQHESDSSGSSTRNGDGSHPAATTSNGGSGDSTAAPAGDAGAAEQQEFPGARKSMFCYKAPSDSLQIQACAPQW